MGKIYLLILKNEGFVFFAKKKKQKTNVGIVFQLYQFSTLVTTSGQSRSEKENQERKTGGNSLVQDV